MLLHLNSYGSSVRPCLISISHMPPKNLDPEALPNFRHISSLVSQGLTLIWQGGDKP